jgi:hypothetical protein
MADLQVVGEIQRKAGAAGHVGRKNPVAVTLEKGLLKRVDEYAKRHEMKRAEMITKGLLLVMGGLSASRSSRS